MSATLFVQIADIEGEAVEKAHAKWIVVDSIGFGMARHSLGEGGSAARGFGKAVFQEMIFSSEVGCHSAPLMTAVANAKSFTKITIDQCKSSDDASSGLEMYMQWTLDDAVVVNYQISGSSEGIPRESWSIMYTKIRCAYKATDPKTLKLTKAKEFAWDVGAGSPA